MIKKRKPKGYWTKEKCQEEALKYQTRSEFIYKSVSAYSKAWENNWLDDICVHMIYTGNKFLRCIYAFEFSDNSVYIGLTYNIKNRIEQHEKRGPVFNHNKLSDKPIFKQLTDYINIDDAKTKEYEYYCIYKEKGWNLLNSAKIKTGGCGGGERKWTKNKCKEDH